MSNTRRSQNDCSYGSRCQCKKCLAAEAEFGASSGAFTDVVNEVASAIRQRRSGDIDAYPQVAVDSLAYSFTEDASVADEAPGCERAEGGQEGQGALAVFETRVERVSSKSGLAPKTQRGAFALSVRRAAEPVPSVPNADPSVCLRTGRPFDVHPDIRMSRVFGFVF